MSSVLEGWPSASLSIPVQSNGGQFRQTREVPKEYELAISFAPSATMLGRMASFCCVVSETEFKGVYLGCHYSKGDVAGQTLATCHVYVLSLDYMLSAMPPHCTLLTLQCA